MFYCDTCGKDRGWPERGCLSVLSRGPCEICGKVTVCQEVSSEHLQASDKQEPLKFLRRGQFKLTIDAIQTTPVTVRKIMGEMIIVRAEEWFQDQTIRYHAYSDLFDEVPSGEFSPEYEITIQDGKVVAKKP